MRPLCLYRILVSLHLLLSSVPSIQVHADNLLSSCVTTYEAEQVALDAAKSDELVQVVEKKTYWLFRPLQDIKPVGFIFYTGAFVEELAYAPLLRALAEQGYPSFLLQVPLDLSFLAPFRASNVIQKYNTNKHDVQWVVGGHSQGGCVAAMYANTHPHDVAGLVILSSFPIPVPVICNLKWQTNIAVVSLWGNLDGITRRDCWEGSQNRLPPDAKFVEIEGGNHDQMGYYGPQEGDANATITREAQQAIVITEILALMQLVEYEYGYDYDYDYEYEYDLDLIFV